MKRFLVYLQAFSLLLSCSPAMASDDKLIDALVDEMNRSTKELRFESHDPPYFVSYLVKEIDEEILTSTLGSETSVERTDNRTVTPVVRLGNYDLDSSNPLTSRQNLLVAIQVEDEYPAIRRALWSITDHSYKFAIRTFEWKKAYLRTNKVPDRLEDMTKEPPTVSIGEKKPLTLDETKWRANVQQLSELFKKYPQLQSSKITLTARVVTNWFVNSEGTRVKESKTLYALKMWAHAQAPDGMPIVNYDVVAVQQEDQLPSLDSLKTKVESFCQNMIAMQSAAKGEQYCGPVLFKGQAAAQLFAQLMAPNLGFAEDYIGKEDWRHPWEHAIGRKVLPEYLSIIDDPRATEFKGTPLIGGYNFDDEGIAAQKVELISNGKLKAFCQSRIPSRHSKHSNGHSMGGHGVPNVLQISSSKTVNETELKDRIADLARDAGLDYILVVERLEDTYAMTEVPSTSYPERDYATPSYSLQPSDPTVAYRLYLDGHKEYVRGLEFSYLSLRAFKDIQAVCDDAAPWLVEPSDCAARHLVTPSILIGELDITPIKPEHTAPPIVPSPLAGN